jgi:hypothetical protein
MGINDDIGEILRELMELSAELRESRDVGRRCVRAAQDVMLSEVQASLRDVRRGLTEFEERLGR